jgi:hypothetical protein
MQPIYVTLSSTAAAAPWRLANWHVTPQEASFAILSSGNSSWAINLTYEDVTGVYPNPRSSTPTAFSLLTDSCSAAFIAVTSSLRPFAGWQPVLGTGGSGTTGPIGSLATALPSASAPSDARFTKP